MSRRTWIVLGLAVVVPIAALAAPKTPVTTPTTPPVAKTAPLVVPEGLHLAVVTATEFQTAKPRVIKVGEDIMLFTDGTGTEGYAHVPLPPGATIKRVDCAVSRIPGLQFSATLSSARFGDESASVVLATAKLADVSGTVTTAVSAPRATIGIDDWAILHVTMRDTSPRPGLSMGLRACRVLYQ